MSAAAIIPVVLEIVAAATKFFPVVADTVSNVKPFAETVFRQLKGDELSDDERAELHRQVDAQYDEFMQPLPPDDASSPSDA